MSNLLFLKQGGTGCNILRLPAAFYSIQFYYILFYSVLWHMLLAEQPPQEQPQEQLLLPFFLL